MNNYEKINLIQEIVQPYFKFEMDDFYGDRGGLPYPKIEQLDKLYFKKIGKGVNKHDEEILLDKIKNLDIGLVELIKIPSFGVYIYINMKPDKKYKMVISYFHYNSQTSDIEKFIDEDNAKDWLCERWGFLLKEELPSNLQDFIYLLHNKYDVVVEMIKLE